MAARDNEVEGTLNLTGTEGWEAVWAFSPTGGTKVARVVKHPFSAVARQRVDAGRGREALLPTQIAYSGTLIAVSIAAIGSTAWSANVE